MSRPKRHFLQRLGILLSSVILGFAIVISFLLLLRGNTQLASAAPIPPPEGYPKLSISTKMVTPTLAKVGGATLWYEIEIVNTGAYTAEGATFTDVIPDHTVYNGKSGSSVPPAPIFVDGKLSWTGTVGFDSSSVITFGVSVDEVYSGTISNVAVINHPFIAEPVTVTAQTVITDDPLLELEKTSAPAIPGAGHPLTYTITVINQGQPATNLPITLTDEVPVNTTLLTIGPDGQSDPLGEVITWKRSVTLGNKESTTFTFSVDVNDVPSGTVITNDDYQVTSQLGQTAFGEPVTVTVKAPIFLIAKHTQPDPPGANEEMTYILTVLNKGSLATGVVVSDTVPTGVTYQRGGTLVGNTVHWDLPSLDTGASAQFTYTVYVADVAHVTVLNDGYGVCSLEGACAWGRTLPTMIEGPTFLVTSVFDPIAKKPGGGGGPVTPTLTVENIGPGNALNATAFLYFGRISMEKNALLVIPPVGVLSPGPDCGDKCIAYRWVGNLAVGDIVTFTVNEGQSTIGGEEGTHYTATVVVTDTLGVYTTEPVTATAVGHVTHFANLVPYKQAPSVIGAGQVLTYTLQVFNSGLTTDTPPYPHLTDTVPLSTTLIHVSDGGISQTVGEGTVISWTLPSMGPGDWFYRNFSVRVDPALVSGTEITNAYYGTMWGDIAVTATYNLSNTGFPVKTLVKEVGLIDSFKEVTPTLARPGPDNLLTYVVRVVNSSPVNLTGVQVHDLLPWQNSTYQRDAVVSSGEIISDIVSIDWEGNVAGLSTELITFTVLVDDGYEGPVTNTAVIHHSSLLEDVSVQAVANISNDPVLRISKTAAPDPVILGNELLYTIRVTNLGQQATELEVYDVVPANTEYVPGSASNGGTYAGGQVNWEILVLPPLETQVLTFRVKALTGNQIVNQFYGVDCSEGASAIGEPVITKTRLPKNPKIYLPLVIR